MELLCSLRKIPAGEAWCSRLFPPDGSDVQLFPEFAANGGGISTNGLLLANDGNFWLTQYDLGTDFGDLFAVSPSNGKIIHDLKLFSPSAAVGAHPSAVIQTKDGILHGLAYDYGNVPKGDFGGGTVFTINVGLPAQ
jgi:hypothetical protein